MITTASRAVCTFCGSSSEYRTRLIEMSPPCFRHAIPLSLQSANTFRFQHELGVIRRYGQDSPRPMSSLGMPGPKVKDQKAPLREPKQERFGRRVAGLLRHGEAS